MNSHDHNDKNLSDGVISDPRVETPEDVLVEDLIESDASPEVIADAVEQQDAADAATTLETLPQGIAGQL